MKLVEIPVSAIRLMDVVHRRGNPDYQYKGKSNADCWVRVRQTPTGYTLVSRWADYMECVYEGYETVRAQIIDENYIQKYGEKHLPLSEIKLTDSMAASTPHEWKIQRARDRYAATKRLDKPITLNADNYVVDGYTRYIVAREVGMKSVPVIYCR